MSSKLSAKLLALALLVVALPSVAFASSTRIDGLGLQGDYVMDYNNVFTYPSLVTQYQNLVYGDLGNKNVLGTGDLNNFQDNNQNPRLNDRNRAMGAILGNLWGGKIGVWSVNFNENATAISPALGAQYFNRNANEALDLLWGWKMQKTSIGIRLNKSYSSLETLNGTDISRPYTGTGPSLGGGVNARQDFNAIASQMGATDWNSLGVGAGATFDLGEGDKMKQLDVSAEGRWLSFEQSDTTGAVKYEDNGGMSYALNARLHWEKEADFHLVPVVNYYHLNMGTKFTDRAGADSVRHNTVSGLNAGLAGNWKLRDSDWFWLGAAYEYSKLDFEQTNITVPTAVGHNVYTYENIPNIFAALESSLWPWFTVRLGAGRPLYSKLKQEDKSATPNVATERKDSPLQYSVGVGFHFAKLDVDAMVNQDFAFTGGWFASGQGETPFSKLSATYRW
jgi:hypothetical protein